ncbi:ABC transporter permease [Clostridium sp. 19966]|nr:ABC transporter permease [Clostridium sp. 19966]
MKPLSVINYNINNKKRFVTSIISVFVAVVFIYVFYSLLASLNSSVHFITVENYKNHSEVTEYSKSEPIEDDILKTLEDNKDVDKLVPFMNYGLRYSVPGTITQVDALALRSSDMSYVMNEYGASIKEGRLPEEGKNEIAIYDKVALNKKVKLGDKVGSSINQFDNLNGEYKIVGILKGNTMLSIVSANDSTMPNYADEQQNLHRGILIFPKEGKLENVNSTVENLDQGKVKLMTLNFAQKEFDSSMNIMSVLDIICLLSIILMVITVGSTKYVHFFNRREELGILNAMGYSKKEILVRAIKEVAALNGIAYLIGLAAAIGISCLMAQNMFDSKGAIGIVINRKSIIMSLYIPLFTTLFTVVPINMMINKLDPIKMIESN